MLSQFEKKILHECYSHYLKTNSREYTYVAKNGDDLVLATNSFYDLEENGYISNLVEEVTAFTFLIEYPLISYMKQEEL